MVDFAHYRSSSRNKNAKQSVTDYLIEFDKKYAAELCQASLQIIQRKISQQFVGTKTLNASLRFLATAIKNAKLRKFLTEHIPDILFKLTLPLMMMTQEEGQLWGENQIEYVRMQVDLSNPWNVKRTNQDLIKALCNIKKTRKNKISDNLAQYLQMIAELLTQQKEQPSQDFRQKEALMHAFGLLNLHIAPDPSFAATAINLLHSTCFEELESAQGPMRARAAWTYG